MMSPLDVLPFLDNYSTLFRGILIAVLVNCLLIIIAKWMDNTKGRPPGPYGLPLVGYLPFLGSSPHSTFSSLAMKYGDIFEVNLLGRPFIILNSLETINEAFVSQSDNFAGRPREFNLLAYSVKNQMVSVDEGYVWKLHKKFLVSNMSTFGVGKSAIEPKLLEIGRSLVDYVERTNEQPHDFHEVLTISTSNAISLILFNKQFAWNDPHYVQLRRDVEDFIPALPGFTFNLVGPLLWLKCKLFDPNFKKLTELTERCFKTMMGMIEDRLKSFNPNEINDYLDAFISEHQKEERLSPAPKEKNWTLRRLGHTLFGMFQVGTDTSSQVLYNAIYLMAKHTEIQDKVQAEMDSVIGTDREPSLADRPRLPYTEAVINEIMRYSMIVPLGLVRVNFEEATVSGFKIPKRSNVIANTWKLARDPFYFKKPDQFDPNNFLDKDGNFAKSEAHLPFSVGKRDCLGANLAKAEIFLFLLLLLQKVTFRASPGRQLNANTTEAMVRCLDRYEVCAILRVS